MHYKFTESSYENAIIELFVDELKDDCEGGNQSRRNCILCFKEQCRKFPRRVIIRGELR